MRHLKLVIFAVYERVQVKRFRVPYQNSYMRTLLKDFLGGNCQNAMIARVSVEELNAGEYRKCIGVLKRCLNSDGDVSLGMMYESL